MRGNIGVRINDGINDQTVTKRVRGLKFSKQANGGHRAASFSITTPLGAFTDLGPSDRAYLYNTSTGAPIWEGYTEAPTPTSGPNGEAYAISALGGMIRAADETRALIYVDKSLDGWEHIDYAPALTAGNAGTYNGAIDTGDLGVRGLRAQIPSGSLVTTNQPVGLDYRALTRAGMKLAAVRTITQSGKNDTGYRAQFYDFLTATNVGDSFQISTTAYDQTQWIGVSIGDTDKCLLQLNRTGGATNVADDTTWTNFTGISVLGRRVNRLGALLNTAAAHGNTALSVRGDQVVEDLLGRLLTFCDPNTSSVEATSFAIDQLAYPDGATAQRVLDDLSDYEPDFLWEILHSTTGGHIFNYRRWPTDPRYEITTRDGYTESGADADLCNRIAVTWTDPAGNQQTTIVTATSATYPALKALEDAGRTRDADPITLPDGVGSLANAQAIGAAELADAAGQPISARAQVRRPIRDLYTGAMVMPWEIEPGYLVTVRETGRLHRLTAMEYDDDSCSTSLELGYPSLTRDQRIARLARV